MLNRFECIHARDLGFLNAIFFFNSSACTLHERNILLEEGHYRVGIHPVGQGQGWATTPYTVDFPVGFMLFPSFSLHFSFCLSFYFPSPLFLLFLVYDRGPPIALISTVLTLLRPIPGDNPILYNLI